MIWMNHFSNLPYKQLLFPPFRKESNVSENEIPIYSTINPIVPPFLPNRKISKFANYPGAEQQMNILQYANQKK